LNGDARLDGIGMTSRRTRVRLVERLRAEGIRDEAVLESVQETPRHLFVDEALASRAYEDSALPIGFGQTISSPWMVARMTEALLEGGPLGKVLEIGTGSGYHTAVLARLVSEVFSIERIEALLTRARRRFRDLRLRNIQTRHADGKAGWPERGPYDGIIAAASPLAIPTALIEQLAPGGRLVLPVGGSGAQQLHRVTRTENGYEQETLQAVSFVPMLPGDR
jgi:protein-L-isoaspartate(D-aspartate) O-methyltransferase